MINIYNNIKKFYRISITYVVTTITCIFILCLTLNLWKANLRIPFAYSGDGIFSSYFIKSIIENGWYFVNNSVGMPFGGQLYDFASSDMINFFIIKLFSIFTSDWGLVLNLFYLLTYVLSALTALYVFRKLGIFNCIAVVFSIIFTIAPYHFFRGEAHLFLSSYFVIPLITLVIIWIFEDVWNAKEKHIYDLIRDKKVILSIAFCFIASSTGIYYAFFAAFFLFIMLVYSIINKRSFNQNIIIAGLIVILIIGVLFNVLPSLIYQLYNGTSLSTKRLPQESEIYGLKIIQLLLPISGHRINVLSRLNQVYSAQAPLINENAFSSLGIIASLGFLLSLFFIFKSKVDSLVFKINRIYITSILNLSSILLATIGGFSSIIAFFITPQIRAYNRISIYISFFSLLALAFVLQTCYEKIRMKNIYKSLFCVLMCILLGLSVFDQVSKYVIPNYGALKIEYDNDKKFINKIEDLVPVNSMIYQFPYVPFPENPVVNKMSDYELFKGYLHSKTLRWSYGYMKARDYDFFYKKISNESIDKSIEEIAIAGFCGIYVDRYGYLDGGVKLDNDLKGILEIEPIISDNSRLAFYDMKNYIKKLHIKYSNNQWEIVKDKLLHPVNYIFGKGFYAIESNTDGNWQWCSKFGELTINNTSKDDRKIIIDCMFATGSIDNSEITITSDIFNQKILINGDGTKFNKSITVSPGKHKFEFSCNAPRVNAPSDTRDLVFRCLDFKIIDE